MMQINEEEKFEIKTFDNIKKRIALNQKLIGKCNIILILVLLDLGDRIIICLLDQLFGDLEWSNGMKPKEGLDYVVSVTHIC